MHIDDRVCMHVDDRVCMHVDDRVCMHVDDRVCMHVDDRVCIHAKKRVCVLIVKKHSSTLGVRAMRFSPQKKMSVEMCTGVCLHAFVSICECECMYVALCVHACTHEDNAFMFLVGTSVCVTGQFSCTI